MGRQRCHPRNTNALLSEDRVITVQYSLHEENRLRHTSDAGCFSSDGETETLHLIDISGPAGQHGTPGLNHHLPPPGSGAHGQRGGNAGPSERGHDAGSIDLHLHHAGGPKTHLLQVSGTVRGDQHERDLDIPNLEMQTDGYLFIEAVGGRGGNGGQGGNGQPGATGSRGRNATRYRNGTNGGPGGNGGHAGDATDGSDGGSGGKVQISLSDQELGLLMLVKGNLTGGSIGFAGRPGHPGIGGKGGKGGSSHSWTETQHYTTHDGKSARRSVRHFNSGGRNGSRGHSGLPSLYHAQDGHQGAAGKLQILVTDATGKRTIYPSPFDLELTTFDVAAEANVIEPDSLISIDQIEVQNSGGMPLPHNYPIRILVETDRWLHSDGSGLLLQQALQPDATTVFTTDGIALRVSDYIVEQPRSRPFRLRHPISPVAWMEGGIGRPFRQFPNGEDIEVRFPVEISNVRSLTSLAPGESTILTWSITNTSDETFDQKHLVRAVKSAIRIYTSDQQTSDQQTSDQQTSDQTTNRASNHTPLVFFDPTDHEHDLHQTPFQQPVRKFCPGDTHTVRTRVGITENTDVNSYSEFSLAVDLHLQRPRSSERSEQYRIVDCRKIQIRVSEIYRRDADARFLLIANARTTSNEIQKWTKLADYFGSGIDIWDISYYGFLDLAKKLKDGESLLEQWRGMTIIIPNNYFTTPEGTTSAFAQLCKTQFLHAAADFDINFYIVGDSQTSDSEQLATALIPVEETTRQRKFTSSQAFLEEVSRWNQFTSKSQQVVGGDSSDVRDFADISLGSLHELKITKRTFLFQPKKRALVRKAEALVKKLTRDDPLHRWIVIHRHDTGKTDTSWGFFRNRQLGTLELRRTLDSTKGSIVHYRVESIDAIDRDFIESPANKHGVFLALKFEDKVDRFIRLVSERAFPRYNENYIDRPLDDAEIEQIGNELVDSILNDIYNEQAIARNAKIWGRSGVETLMPKLNYLAKRAMNYGVTFDQMQENTTSIKLLFELLGSMRALAESAQSVWDSSWFPTSYFKRSRAVSTHMRRQTDSIMTSIFGRELTRWEKMTRGDNDYNSVGKSRKESVRDAARQTAEQQTNQIAGKRKRDRRFSRYVRAQQQPGITYDPEILLSESRVMSGQAFDQLLATERSDAQQRQRTRKAVLAKRSELLVPLDVEEQTGSLYEQPQSLL